MRHDDPFGSARITSIKNQVKDERNELEWLKIRKKSKKRKLAKSVETELSKAIKNKKTKIMINFDKNE